MFFSDSSTFRSKAAALAWMDKDARWNYSFVRIYKRIFYFIVRTDQGEYFESQRFELSQDNLYASNKTRPQAKKIKLPRFSAELALKLLGSQMHPPSDAPRELSVAKGLAYSNKIKAIKKIIKPLQDFLKKTPPPTPHLSDIELQSYAENLHTLQINLDELIKTIRAINIHMQERIGFAERKSEKDKTETIQNAIDQLKSSIDRNLTEIESLGHEAREVDLKLAAINVVLERYTSVASESPIHLDNPASSEVSTPPSIFTDEEFDSPFLFGGVELPLQDTTFGTPGKETFFGREEPPLSFGFYAPNGFFPEATSNQLKPSSHPGVPLNAWNTENAHQDSLKHESEWGRTIDEREAHSKTSRSHFAALDGIEKTLSTFDSDDAWLSFAPGDLLDFPAPSPSPELLCLGSSGLFGEEDSDIFGFGDIDTLSSDTLPPSQRSLHGKRADSSSSATVSTCSALDINPGTSLLESPDSEVDEVDGAYHRNKRRRRAGIDLSSRRVSGTPFAFFGNSTTTPFDENPLENIFDL